MKLNILIIASLVVLFVMPCYAQVRYQVAGSMLSVTDEKPIYTAQAGLSVPLSASEGGGALYMIMLGKYGASAKGGNVEFAFFPIKPTGHGFRLFFVIGGNFTEVEMQEMEPVSYLQFASGLGLYWDFTPQVALWSAFKLEQSEDFQTAQVGLGLSAGI